MTDFFEKLSSKTGLSEEVVRRVMHEAKTIVLSDMIESEDNYSQIPGLVSFYYKVAPSLGVAGEIQGSARVRVKPSASLGKQLDKLREKKLEGEKEDLSYLLNYEKGADSGNARPSSSDPRLIVEQIDALR